MKILSLHCDYIKFKPIKKAIKEPEQLSKEEEKERTVKEALVIFTAVEQEDTLQIVDAYIRNIKDIASQVKAKNIVLYPYAHLSANLSSPVFAQEVFKEAEKKLKQDKSYTVTRAPFGYYKELELKCKGHPLAELSREIRLEAGTEVKLKEGKSKAQEIRVVERDLTENERKVLLKEISKTKLDREKLKENDHRILGQRLDLFSFNETAPGMVFWHNNGLIIYNELIKYWREEHKKAGYQEVSTPFILDKKLWLISGHWEKYRENIFMTKYEGRDFAVKPMNCPGGILVYKTKPKSYRELPLRVAELGVVHRQELSGVLAGLFRVIKFIQDDAHIYCTEEQLESEISEIIDLTVKIYKKFNFAYNIELSTKPAKRIGSDIMWDKAEKVLQEVLKKKKINYKLNKGEGAFYGPKIDFHIKDSLGRSWQCGTIQLDFAMPERFELEYTTEDNKQKRPVMVHRAILGSLERFIGVLLEHLNGNLPTWLSPFQVRVLSFTDRNVKACKEFIKNIAEKIPELRIDADFRDVTVDTKVRDVEMIKAPYSIVIGDKEEKNKTLAVRPRGKKPEFGVKAEAFIEKIKKEIFERS
ncbi:threonine--tRNA ligase [Candidatus Pacearchaeota archaeon]|nr:threonine--tRNA ligase [Candidatus Pacearchaeota archaeon]